jgi:hypothetical protein
MEAQARSPTAVDEQAYYSSVEFHTGQLAIQHKTTMYYTFEDGASLSSAKPSDPSCDKCTNLVFR